MSENKPQMSETTKSQWIQFHTNLVRQRDELRRAGNTQAVAEITAQIKRVEEILDQAN